MILKPIIEMLAAIPSVAIGFLGIVVVGPGLASVFGLQNGLNALNGSILLAIIALPTIVTISEDAINAVPKSHREASFWALFYGIFFLKTTVVYPGLLLPPRQPME
jgi:phosphate transport system permease protein